MVASANAGKPPAARNLLVNCIAAQTASTRAHERAVVARHEIPPAGDGKNIRRFRASQGKARRSGTFFPDRIGCFPRYHDMPALTHGQRNLA
jgi:hypothetical protein